MEKYGIVVDRKRCLGFGTCVDIAPKIFTLDYEGKAEAPHEVEARKEKLLDAAKGCPALAITIVDGGNGKPLYP